MTPRLALRGVTVRFGARPALTAVDLSVADGEVVVILGPSGSGKSTLLRTIAGLQAPTEGAVEIDGVDRTTTPPHRRGIGLMFQDHALFPHLDVGHNVAFGLHMQGLAPAETAAGVADLLELVGLPGMEGRAIQTLSGGEQQRVALARALAPAPRVLLLDEPLGALDRPLRERLVEELRSLFSRLAVTVVAVTHDQHEAFAMADRLVVMDEGRVLQDGPPAEVWAAPDRARVAHLLGFTNVVPASVVDGRLRTPWGDLGPGAGPVAAVLVRPEGVHPDGLGPVEGVVASRTFAGTHTRLRVAVADAPQLTVDVPGAADERLVSGAPIRLRVDPAAVQGLPR